MYESNIDLKMHEAELPDSPGGINRIDAAIQPEVHADLVALRKDFVTRRHWRTEQHNELDMYDDNPDTIHVGSWGQDGRLVAAMRLTPLDTGRGFEALQDSLSYSMIPEEYCEQVTAGLARRRLTGELHDFTRLVVNQESESARETIPEILKLLGAAHETAKQRSLPDKQQSWFFVIDERAGKMLNYCGIMFDELAAWQSKNMDGSTELVKAGVVPDVDVVVGSLYSTPRFQINYQAVRAGAMSVASNEETERRWPEL